MAEVGDAEIGDKEVGDPGPEVQGRVSRGRRKMLSTGSPERGSPGSPGTREIQLCYWVKTAREQVPSLLHLGRNLLKHIRNLAIYFR